MPAFAVEAEVRRSGNPQGARPRRVDARSRDTLVCLHTAPGSVARVRLAGVSVLETNVAALAELLLEAGFEETADVLLLALDNEQDLVPLSIQDREAILRALDDPPLGLAELRGVLLREHEWRVREGLV